MAQKTLVQLVDDLDGKPITNGRGETVSFGLDGKDYDIDLSAKNAAKLLLSTSELLAGLAGGAAGDLVVAYQPGQTGSSSRTSGSGPTTTASMSPSAGGYLPRSWTPTGKHIGKTVS